MLVLSKKGKMDEGKMALQGVRGAITVEQDNEDQIIAATKNLLFEIVKANQTMKTEDLACVFFTMTDDLHLGFPAKAAREMGWRNVPLMCSTEISVTNGLPFCIRVLLLWNTNMLQTEISHVYLGRAKTLRPDLLK